MVAESRRRESLELAIVVSIMETILFWFSVLLNVISFYCREIFKRTSTNLEGHYGYCAWKKHVVANRLKSIAKKRDETEVYFIVLLVVYT